MVETYWVSCRSTAPAMVAARISVDDGVAAAGTGRRWLARCRRHPCRCIRLFVRHGQCIGRTCPNLERSLADYGGPVRVHLIDGTYELFRQHFGQVARHADAGPFAATVGVVASTLQLVSRRRHPPRRRQRPRDRELPQRPVARLQDQRRDGSGAARADPGHGGGPGQRRVHDVGDGRVRGRRRARALPQRWPTPTRGSSRC